jgi:ATP-binding protein involved in chromosome partitioning
VTQFVNDVDWGDLDYLILDLQPGTGDIQLSLAQKVKVTGSLLVTTPQDVALADVYRAKSMFDRVRIPVMGLVENMSYFVADDGKRYDIFGSGGGERASEELSVPLLGQIPIEPKVRACGDSGEPIVQAAPDADSSNAFRSIAKRLVEAVEASNAAAEADAPKGRGLLKIVTN